MSAPDGGQVFPVPGSQFSASRAGTALRDFFAGKALHGLLAFGWGVDVVAEKAYAAADAMLAERAKRLEPTQETTDAHHD